MEADNTERGARQKREATVTKDSLLDQLLTPAEVAEKLCLSVATLANWRCRGRGPKYVKAGRVVLYPMRFIEEWLEGNVHGGETAAPDYPVHVAPGLSPSSKAAGAKRPSRFGGVKTKAMKAREHGQ